MMPRHCALRRTFRGDNFLVYSTWAWLEAQVKTGGSPVYRYLFALPSPGDPYHPVSAGAFHSDEIEYVFGNLDSRKGATFRPEDYKLSDLMQTYWTNFARTGDPNGDPAPHWPTYDAAGNWQVMRLSPDPAAAGPASRSISFSAAGMGRRRSQVGSCAPGRGSSRAQLHLHRHARFQKGDGFSRLPMIANFDLHRGDAPVAFGYHVGLLVYDQRPGGGVGAPSAG